MTLAEFHLHQGVGQWFEPHPAMFSGDEGAPQALTASALAQGSKRLIKVLGSQAVLSRYTFVLYKLAYFGTYGFGFFGYLKINQGAAPAL